MVLAIIFFILSCIISIISVKKDNKNIINFFHVFKDYCIMFFCIYILSLITLSIFTVDVGTKTEVLYEIYGLESNKETESSSNSFVLGCGILKNSSTTKIKYYFFKETTKGKILKSIVAENSNVYIKETNERNPCLMKEYKIKKQNKLFELLFWKMDLKTEKSTILIVPENTIKIEYNVEV